MVHFSSLAIVFLLCVASSHAVKNVDFDTICKGTENPSFCLTLLNSKPGTNRDLVSLAQYTMDVLLVNTTNTIKLVNMLLSKSRGDYEARYHYRTCLSHFVAISDTLKMTPFYMESGEYDNVLEHAVGVRIDVDNCISGDSPGDPHYPYHDTSMLPKYANMVDQDAMVFAAVVQHLNKPI
ncbi:unnamed protein product [Lathyrus sativus]|nr:unnamed protein product [Lathyrus sativus]